jgi:hypothetical protein
MASSHAILAEVTKAAWRRRDGRKPAVCMDFIAGAIALNRPRLAAAAAQRQQVPN